LYTILVKGFLFDPRPQIRNKLEQHMSCNLTEYKEFIDNEMLLILGQMDKPTLIFDHVYLVRIVLYLFLLFYLFDCFYSYFSSIFVNFPQRLLAIISNNVQFCCLCRAPSGTLPTWRNYVNAGELIVHTPWNPDLMYTFTWKLLLSVNNWRQIVKCSILIRLKHRHMTLDDFNLYFVSAAVLVDIYAAFQTTCNLQAFKVHIAKYKQKTWLTRYSCQVYTQLNN